MILNVHDFFEEELKFLPVDLEVEGVKFELIPLTDILIAAAKKLEQSEELILFAADNGLSFNSDRLTDNSKTTRSIEKLWLHENMPSIDPTVQHKVGEYVLEISGLDEHLLDLLAEEKEAEEDTFIDGDKELPTGDLGAIQAQLNAQNNIN